tara:strand:- start:443 stop:568 length:126 start_codon:yes stop_codon:yes gene_type:complete
MVDREGLAVATTTTSQTTKFLGESSGIYVVSKKKLIIYFNQ